MQYCKEYEELLNILALITFRQNQDTLWVTNDHIISASRIKRHRYTLRPE